MSDKSEAAKELREGKDIRKGYYYNWNDTEKGDCAGIHKVTFIDRHYEVFIVLNGTHVDGHPIVAFDSAEDMYGAIVKVARKTYAGGYTWKTDKPRE